ncbi:FkbM family methyltransferase [Novosphingobium sp. G106]|uniref:FkbM family methyltransferase n=1 Tax=Novosphingobium sp. G106 TaxID=2849500 RepID=UPI0028112B23|nr:FkbM family methyltransferase [Novosphingobium sp. G106]
MKAKMYSFLRDAQSHFPFLRPLKFNTYNLGTRLFGMRIDDEFRLLSRMKVGLALDIGANWGQSVWALKHVAKPQRIVCFEPNSGLFGRLDRTFRDDATVQVENCALSDQPGSFDLYIPRYRNYVYDGLASLSYDEARLWLNSDRVADFKPHLLHVEQEKVAVRTLDPYGFDPDVVKIDVQGAELLVVKGGIETFRRNQPLMIVEAPSTELVELLAGMGMKAYHFDGKTLSADWAKSKNTVFLSDARRQEIGF